MVYTIAYPLNDSSLICQISDNCNLEKADNKCAYIACFMNDSVVWAESQEIVIPY